MNINFNDYEQRQAFIKCLKLVEEDNEEERFTIQNDGMGYNSDYGNVFLMLEPVIEGFTLAVVCPVGFKQKAQLILTDDETGEEFDYSLINNLRKTMSCESDDEEETTP